MPAPRILPGKTELRHLLAQDLTHQQIADLVSEQVGVRVSRTSVSAAISRAGLSGDGPRYEDVIPWRVKTEHSTHYAVRMLRALGRRRASKPLAGDLDGKLDSWLDKLRGEDAVVVYLPDTEEGFFYVPRREGTGDGENGIPIRRD